MPDIFPDETNQSRLRGRLRSAKMNDYYFEFTERLNAAAVEVNDHLKNNLSKARDYLFENLFDFFIIKQEDLLSPCREKLKRFPEKNSHAIKLAVVTQLYENANFTRLLWKEFSRKNFRILNEKGEQCEKALSAFFLDSSDKNKELCEARLADYQTISDELSAVSLKKYHDVLMPYVQSITELPAIADIINKKVIAISETNNPKNFWAQRATESKSPAQSSPDLSESSDHSLSPTR